MPLPSADDADDFATFCDTVLASERGRRFLQEYLQRNRHADIRQALTATARIEGLIRERSGEPYQSFRGELQEMAKAVADAKPEEVEPRSPDAGRSATPAGEGAQLPSDAIAVAERIRGLAQRLRVQTSVPPICGQIEAVAEAILSMPALRDLNDRRARQLTDALGHLERRIEVMLANATAVRAQPAPAGEASASAVDAVRAPAVTDEPTTGHAHVVRTILAVQSDLPMPRSSASLFEEPKALSNPDVARGELAAEPPAAATESTASGATPPHVDVAVAEAMAPIPMRDENAASPEATTLKASNVTAKPTSVPIDGPLAALMELTDEERIALFT